ncbi:unnamed protein product [Cercospora beticola]|nr:unnamed protein product [Cercospora beticola]
MNAQSSHDVAFHCGSLRVVADIRICIHLIVRQELRHSSAADGLRPFGVQHSKSRASRKTKHGKNQARKPGPTQPTMASLYGHPIPQHEADHESQFWGACLEAFRHPTTLPRFFRVVYHDTKAYYAGRDLVDLEREELIENLTWMRKVTISAAASASMSLLFLIAQLILCRIEVHEARKVT